MKAQSAQVEQDKAARADLKVTAVLALNSKCEDKLLELMGKPANSQRTVLKNASLENFTNRAITVPMLSAFVTARVTDTLPAPKGAVPKNKGKAADALVAGSDCLLAKAMLLKNGRYLKLKAPSGATGGGAAAATAAAAVAVPPTVVVVGGGGGSGGLSASALLLNKRWRDTARANLTSGPGGPLVPTAEDGSRADLLARLLAPRLMAHVQSKVDKERRSSWTITLMEQNLSTVAALAVLFGMARSNLCCISPRTALLMTSPSRFVLVPSQGAIAELCGAYMHKDKESLAAVRIGKTGPGVKRGFGTRCNAEHPKAAMLKTLTDASSLFYGSYLSKNAELSSSIRRGYHEDDLDVYVVVGYDQADESACAALCAPASTTGIFQWPASSLEDVRKATGLGAATLEVKQLHAVGYMLELGFELMLSPDDDVSESPGFESFGLRCF